MNLDLNKDLSLDDLMIYVNEVRKEGYLFVIKYDNQRENDFITVLITSNKTDSQSIRLDGEDLCDLIFRALSMHYSRKF